MHQYQLGHQRQILSMYAKGMTAYNIEAPIQNIYGISASDSVVSQIADKYLPAAKNCKSSPCRSSMQQYFCMSFTTVSISEGKIVKK